MAEAPNDQSGAPQKPKYTKKPIKVSFLTVYDNNNAPYEIFAFGRFEGVKSMTCTCIWHCRTCKMMPNGHDIMIWGRSSYAIVRAFKLYYLRTFVNQNTICFCISGRIIIFTYINDHINDLQLWTYERHLKISVPFCILYYIYCYINDWENIYHIYVSICLCV